MISLIIISYNSAEILINQLGSLLDTRQYQPIIIDNASPDGSAEILRSRFPFATVIALTHNIGYGRAANVGLRSVKSPYALLLNPDLSASVEQIQKLLDHARHDPESAIWGPSTKAADFTGGEPEAVEWISGCAMLFDVRKIHQVGLFDENIFLFFEETDLCQRILDAGYGIKLCRDVYFNHTSGCACPSNPAVEWLKHWHYGWSRCYFYSKHSPLDVKRNPKRQHAQYRWKALIAITKKKRAKYKAQAAGSKAFLDGEKAFLSNGLPNR